MGCADCGSRAVQPSTGELTVALAGNPNCGKTALFNALTGVRQRTGNWPGVTVDRKEGRFDVGQRRVTLVDLPDLPATIGVITSPTGVVVVRARKGVDPDR